MSFVNGLLGLGVGIVSGTITEPASGTNYNRVPISFDIITGGVTMNVVNGTFGPVVGSGSPWGTLSVFQIFDQLGNPGWTGTLATPVTPTQGELIYAPVGTISLAINTQFSVSGGNLVGVIISGSTLVNCIVSGQTAIAFGSQYVPVPVVFTGQVAAQPPKIDTLITQSGVIGDGGATAAPPYRIMRTIINDNLALNNAGATIAWDLIQNLGVGNTGGRTMIRSILNINQSPGSGSTHRQYAGGIVGNIFANAPIAGSTPSHPLGGLFGAGADKLVIDSGATNYSIGVASREIDYQTTPSNTLATFAGSVNSGGGDTVGLNFSSASGGFNISATYTTQAGDDIPIVVNGVGGAILYSAALDQQEIGPGFPGAGSPSGANILGLSWPVRWSDLVITPVISSGSAISIGLTSPYVSGGSVLNRFYMTFVSLAGDGSSPYGNDYPYDSFLLFNKQSRKNGWSQGAPKSIILLGGQGALHANDPDPTDPIVNSQWPLDPKAIWIYPIAPTTSGGSNDTPITQPESAAVITGAGVVFTRGGIGPFDFSGWRLWGDGAQTIGGAQITRLQGDTGVAGIKISATGWEAKSFVVSRAGGSPSLQPHVGRYVDKEPFITPYGGQFTVNGLTANGGIAGAAYITDDAGHTNYPCTPQTAMPATVLDVLTGSGINAQITVVWTPANTIQIGEAGQIINLAGTVTGTITGTVTPNVVASGTSYGTSTILAAGTSIVTSGAGAWLGLPAPGSTSLSGKIVNLSGGDVTLGVTGTVSLNGGSSGVGTILSSPGSISWGFNSATVAYAL